MAWARRDSGDYGGANSMSGTTGRLANREQAYAGEGQRRRRNGDAHGGGRRRADSRCCGDEGDVPARKLSAAEAVDAGLLPSLREHLRSGERGMSRGRLGTREFDDGVTGEGIRAPHRRHGGNRGAGNRAPAAARKGSGGETGTRVRRGRALDIGVASCGCPEGSTPATSPLCSLSLTEKKR